MMLSIHTSMYNLSVLHWKPRRQNTRKNASHGQWDYSTWKGIRSRVRVEL